MLNKLKAFAPQLKIAAAIVILLALSFACFMKAGGMRSSSKAAREVAFIAQGVHQLYAHKNSYWMLSSDSLKSNNILINFRYKNGQLRNALGKPVLVGKGENGDIVMPGDRSFDIVYTDLTTKECLDTAAYQYEQHEILGLLQITIISKEKSQTFDWGAKTYKLPVSRHEAENFCSDGSKVVWTFE